MSEVKKSRKLVDQSVADWGSLERELSFAKAKIHTYKCAN